MWERKPVKGHEDRGDVLIAAGRSGQADRRVLDITEFTGILGNIPYCNTAVVETGCD